MRPVRLDMNGFASFRNPTVIDFADADYFALVGPTGAGKSTVIDAITFALYGTVPRWEDQRMVTPALAPTATRGIVRLVFDADGTRYAVAREVRRSGGKTSRVSMHASRLERLHDPDDLDGDSDVLAAESEVTAAIEKLLGLTYQHFTTCVALPQNQFAEFLHAKPSVRQDILSSLLGHQLYEELQTRANTRAREQRATCEALAKTLEGYADASADRVAELTKRAADLDALQTWFDNDGHPQLDDAARNVSDAAAVLTALNEKKQALELVQIPAEVATLDADVTAAALALEAATGARNEAEAADEHAALQASAFRPRHELLDLQRNWTELDQAEQELPSLIQQVQDAEADHDAARTAVQDTERAVEGLRQVASSAATAAQQAAAVVANAQAHAVALAAITVPEMVAQLTAALAELDDRRTAAARDSAQAEAELAAAKAVLEAAPGEAALNTGARAAVSLGKVLTADLDDWDARAEAADALARAVHALAEAQAAHAAATAQLDAARLADEAGLLRAHLVSGRPCPVCEQPVTTVPAAHEISHVATAQAALSAAEEGLRSAEAEHGKLERTLTTVQATRAATLRQTESDRSELPAALQTIGTGEPAAADLLDALSVQVTADTGRASLRALAEAASDAAELLGTAAAHRAELTAAVHEADKRRLQASEARTGIDQDATELDRQRRDATTELNAARDTVASLSPPPLDPSNLASAWAALTQWAGERHAAITDQLPALRDAADTADTQATTAEQELAVGIDTLTALRETETTRARELTKLTQRRDQTESKRQQLTTVLTGQPAKADIQAMLERLTELEQAAADPRAALVEAREQHAEAADNKTAIDGRAKASWHQLAAARDPLTRYGAPTLNDASLAAVWDQLASWASAQLRQLDKQIKKAEATAASANRDYQTAAAVISEKLTGRGLQPPEPNTSAQLGATVTRLVATAHAGADAAVSQAEDRLAERSRLEDQHKDAEQNAQVATSLATLLRSDAFQAWLLESALASLVADASDILLEMSSGQFELRHCNKDLEVVDHNDADSTRPVRTLSGGETFQASLSLALALSRQVSALAASGAAKLESIFLDEGFGSLDVTSLEVVATTLENLAQSGERMVGVITHVQALADRIPVRFRVIRAGTTSSIERVSR